MRRDRSLFVITLCVAGALAFAPLAFGQSETIDPYATAEPVTAFGGAGGSADNHLPSPCNCKVQWRIEPPVIDVSGFGFIGVEGANAGVLRDPSDGKRKIYVTQGFGAGDTRAVRVFNLATQTWSIGPSDAAGPTNSEGSGAVVGNKLYTFGGRGTSGVTRIFDPAGGGSWAGGAGMPTPRSGFAAVEVKGKIHVIGGRTCGTPHCGPGLATHEVYDPVADAWAAAAPLPIPVGDCYAAVTRGRHIYVIGGFDGVSPVDHNQVYDAITDTWAPRAPMPTPRSNAIAGTIEHRVVVIGGLTTSSVSSDSTVVEMYDPLTDTWCTGPSKPTATSEMGASGVTTPFAIHAIGSGAFGRALRTHEALRVTGKPICKSDQNQPH